MMSPGPTTASSTCCSGTRGRGECSPCLGDASAVAAVSGVLSAPLLMLAAAAASSAAVLAAARAAAAVVGMLEVALTLPTICSTHTYTRHRVSRLFLAQVATFQAGNAQDTLNTTNSLSFAGVRRAQNKKLPQTTMNHKTSTSSPLTRQLPSWMTYIAPLAHDCPATYTLEPQP